MNLTLGQSAALSLLVSGFAPAGAKPDTMKIKYHAAVYPELVEGQAKKHSPKMRARKR
jgi:hypothetical protein